ncbi:rod shape-determining protein RodA, partial [Polaribacter sp.]
MRQERNNIFVGIDFTLVFLYLFLVGFGWLNIYAASRTTEDVEFLNFSTEYGKQLIFICLTPPLIVLILFFNSKFYEKFSVIFYALSILSLLGLFVFGKTINGATSWYNFGFIGLQPSEFVKVFTALAVAKLLSDRQFNFNLIKNQVKAFIIIFLPAFLIILQPDAGSALIYLAFFFVLNREGLSLNYILLGLSTLLIFISTIYFGPETIITSLFILITFFVVLIIKKAGKRFLRFNWYKIVGVYLLLGVFVFGTNYFYKHVLASHQKDRFDVLLGIKTDN